MLNTRAKDLVIRFSAGMCSLSDDDQVRKCARGMMVLCWKTLTPDQRRQFLSRVDVGPDADFLEFQERWPERGDATLEAAARHWGYILPGLGGKDREFGNSIAKLLRFNREPSDKQAEWMKRLYSDWKAAQDFEEGVVE